MADNFVTFTATIPTIIIVFQFVKNFFGIGGTAAQITSWLTAFAVTIAAHFLGWGIWAELVWPTQLLIYSFMAGIAANLGYDVGLLKNILQLIDEQFFGK